MVTRITPENFFQWELDFANKRSHSLFANEWGFGYPYKGDVYIVKVREMMAWLK